MVTSEISNEIQARFVKVFIMSLSFFSGMKKKKKKLELFLSFSRVYHLITF